MDRAELFEQWQQHKDRPAWVREHKEELSEYVDTDTPIPGSDSLYQVEQWLQAHKGTVTRQLKPENGGSDNTDESEGSE